MGQRLSKHLRTAIAPNPSGHYQVPFSCRHSHAPGPLQQYLLYSEVPVDSLDEYSIKHVFQPQLDPLLRVLNAIFGANTKYKESPVVNAITLFQ